MAENERKPFLLAGLGLIGFAGWQLLQKKPAPGPSPTPTPTPGPTTALSFPAWLAICRGDVVSGLSQGRYRDVIGQYARENTPGFWGRTDILGAVGAGRWNEIVGQWLRENAASFWNRGDVQAGVVTGRLGDVFGQFCREAGAARCSSLPAPTQGNAPPAVNRPGGGPGGAPGTSPPPPAPPPPSSGGAAIVSDPKQIAVGWVVSTSCTVGVADYLIDPAGIGYDVLPYNWAPLYRQKRWIENSASWAQLGISRSAIHLVSADALAQIKSGPSLKYAPTLRGSWQWFNGAPRSRPSSGNAGYCA